jgi:hypothetical protein
LPLSIVLLWFTTRKPSYLVEKKVQAFSYIKLWGATYSYGGLRSKWMCADFQTDVLDYTNDHIFQ